MANKLGAAFLRCSLGPLHYAGGCILSTKVKEGLAELGADNLHGGLTRGIDEAARHAGVRVADVEALLPMAEVRAVAARLDAAQRAAVDAWQMYAGHLGGLMKGVADLTVDGRAPDVSQFLARLAKKVVRDRPLSEPLAELSDAVASWLDLVERCADLIGDGQVLARAFRARRRRRLGAVGAAGLLMVGCASVALWISAVRGRVDEALGAADACAASAIDPADLERASSAQRERAAALRATCDETRRREAEARAEEEKREAEARAIEEKKRDREQRCATLAGKLAAGAVSGEDAAVAGAQAALIARVAQGALDRADVATEELPCADTPSGAKIAEAFAAALAASPAAWARADEVSERSYAALLARKESLPGAPRQVLGQHADRNAMKALVSRDEARKARAARVCRLVDELGVGAGKYCKTLFVLAAKR